MILKLTMVGLSNRHVFVNMDQVHHFEPMGDGEHQYTWIIFGVGFVSVRETPEEIFSMLERP